MNVVYDSEYDSVTLTCPKCGSTVEIDELDFRILLNPENGSRKCVDCGSEYTVSTVLLDPRSPTLREPEPAFAGASIAPTLSGLYNCQLCGREKCSQPGICEECLTPPTESEIKSWSEA